MRLGDIAFPYKAKRSFGIVSFAFVFLVVFLEAELVVFVALGIIAHRIDLFLGLQQDILPAAAFVSLVASAVFAWRARAWTRARIEAMRAWGGHASTSSYAEKLAQRRSE